MKTWFLLALLLFLLALPACNTFTPEPTPVVIDSPVPPEPTQTEPTPLECNTAYTHHELSGPYQQDKYNPQPIFTFTPDEFLAVLSPLGITAVCVPMDVGAPYPVYDWDAAQGSARQGHMSIYSFEDWRAGSIIYATYDFARPSEYDTFASSDDYDAMQATSASGFERIKVGLCYGNCTVYKTYIYPFADHYVAVTLNLGAYEVGDALDQQVARFTAGEFPEDLHLDLDFFETLVRGIQFK